MQNTKIDRQSKIIGFLSAFLLHFLVFGFPIQSFIPFILNIDSNPINIGFRAFFLFIAIVIIFVSVIRNKINKIKKGWLFFIFFWIIYSLRLIHDIEFKHLSYLNTDSFYVYSFAFGVALIPSIAVHLSVRYINFLQSSQVFFIILVISNLCLTYSVLSFGHWDLTEILLSRANVSIKIDGQEKSIVNPITIGFFGEMLAISAIHFLSFPIFKNKKYILYALIILGLLNLVLGASRGPMAFFILLLFFEMFLITKKKINLGIFFFKTVIVGLLVISSLVSFFISKQESGDIEIINRLSQTAEKQQMGEKEERNFEFASAWNQFLGNPILGDAFVCDFDASYSHNLFLDILMATGIIGAITFLSLLSFLFSNAQYIVKNIKSKPYLSIFLSIFMGNFLITMTSGGLFMSSGFWMSSAFLIGINTENNKN